MKRLYGTLITICIFLEFGFAGSIDRDVIDFGSGALAMVGAFVCIVLFSLLLRTELKRERSFKRWRLETKGR